eukprot:1212475-Pleurochrysis_carterae.AAC.2
MQRIRSGRIALATCDAPCISLGTDSIEARERARVRSRSASASSSSSSSLYAPHSVGGAALSRLRVQDDDLASADGNPAAFERRERRVDARDLRAKLDVTAADGCAVEGAPVPALSSGGILCTLPHAM